MLPSLPLRSLALLPLLALGACAIHHDSAAPAVPGATAGWIEAGAPEALSGHWWQDLHDPQLDSLIDRALQASPDLTEAEARLRLARANLAATRGAALPQLSATTSATTNAQSGNGMIPFSKFPGVSREYDLFDGGFDASWEIDLWGRRASANRAAAARSDASAADRDGVRLQLASEVARIYTDLRLAQARRANLVAQVAALSDLATLQAARFAAGEAARDDSLALRQQRDSARASLATLEGEVSADAFALATLTGQPPEATVPLAAAPAAIPHAPAVALVGLRSDVLRRRPDVRSAAANLAAAHADVDVAHAALFPSLSLTGSIGQQARSAGDLFADSSSRFGFGPSLHWPIFAGGQLRAQLGGAKASADAAAARYEKAVLGALSDSETALNRLARAGEAEDAATAAAEATRATRSLSDRRFTSGEDSRLQRLQAELAMLSAEASESNAQAARTTAYVALGKALGAP